MRKSKLVRVIFLSVILFFRISSLAIAAAGDTKTAAILPFKNSAGTKYEGFVRGLPDMLATSLGQSKKISVIERVQVKKAVDNFKLEKTDIIDQNTAIQMGQWLGANYIVLGSFTEFAGAFRIDARLIDVKTGKFLEGQAVKASENDVLNAIDRLGAMIIHAFTGEKIEIDQSTAYKVKKGEEKTAFIFINNVAHSMGDDIANYAFFGEPLFLDGERILEFRNDGANYLIWTTPGSHLIEFRTRRTEGKTYSGHLRWKDNAYADKETIKLRLIDNEGYQFHFENDRRGYRGVTWIGIGGVYIYYYEASKEDLKPYYRDAEAEFIEIK